MSDTSPNSGASGRKLSKISLVALAILGFLLPLELERAWVQIGPFEVTNLEILVAFVLILAFIQWVYKGFPSFRLPKTWLWLGVLFLAALLISSLAAPIYRDNALTAALRTVSGIAVMLAVIVIIKSKRDLAVVSAGLAAGALLAAVVGLGEVIWGNEFAWLQSFRSASSLAGVFLRLSGPFDYANQAAMFFEAVLPLTVALAVTAWRIERKALTVVFSFSALVLIQAALATYSRSAIVIVVIFALVVLASVLWIRRRNEGREWLVFVVLGVGSLVIVLGNLIANPVWRMRFSSEGDAHWYEAHLHVPENLQLVSEQEMLVTVTMTNDGSFTWRSSGIAPVFLAARWVHPDSESQLTKQLRWPLTRAVPPGQSETMVVPLRAPALAGEFKLVWDLVQEEVTWFGAKSGRETSSAVIVSSSDPELADAVEEKLESGELVADWQIPAPIPGRLTLWKAAWNLLRERPLFGIGLDNFRLRYGDELGYELWNQTVHSNNWYIETVVSLGLLGALPFLLWLGLLVIDLVRRARSGGIWSIALAAAIFAYIIHGFLDYFLLFNATALLFWMLAGMWAALIYHIDTGGTSGV